MFHFEKEEKAVFHFERKEKSVVHLKKEKAEGREGGEEGRGSS